MEQNSELHWFPMRITYNRELKIKELLDRDHIENFLPMKYDFVDTIDGRKRMLVPAIHNLLFVRSTKEHLTDLKMHKQEFQPMRYMTQRTQDGGGILVVPDKQMDNFMKVASVQDDSVMFLDNEDYLKRVGQRVQIIDGCFGGVEGVIKRIKKNKRVVVQIEGVAAVAIAFVPSAFLRFID